VTPEEMAAISTNIAVWFLAAARVKALLEKRGLSTAGLNAYTARVMSYAKDLPVGDAQGRGELFVLDRKARIAQARGKAWEKLFLEHDRALIVFTHKAAARVAQAAKSKVRATRAPAAAAAAERAAPRGVHCNKFFNSTNGTYSTAPAAPSSPRTSASPAAPSRTAPSTAPTPPPAPPPAARARAAPAEGRPRAPKRVPEGGVATSATRGRASGGPSRWQPKTGSGNKSGGGRCVAATNQPGERDDNGVGGIRRAGKRPA
jgi:hypothetical protein